MKKQWVAIVDRDTEYADRLAGFLNEKLPQGVFAVAFSSMEQWTRYEKREKFRVLLTGEESVPETEELPPGCRCLCLRETPAGDESSSVYKYQSGEKLLQKILEGTRKRTLVKKAHCRYLGVYSPIRRCLKTSLALALGQYYGEMGKTLVVSLDLFSGLGTLLGKESFNLSEVLYYWKKKEGFEEFFFQAVAPVRDMEVLLPVWNPLDIPVIAGRDICRFLSDVMGFGRYETLILDVGEGRENLLELMEPMEHIYTPVGWNTVDKAKLSDYCRFLEARGGEAIPEKTEYVTFPAFLELEASENYLEELLWGGFYSFVTKQLLGGA